MNKEEFLRGKGIDIESALTYLGDLDMFDEILKDFYDGLDEQLAEIEKFKNNSDMPNYAILVHAFKSNCRSLGMTSFAEVAYQHELESKANNLNFVNEHFNELLEVKDKIKSIALEYLNL